MPLVLRIENVDTLPDGGPVFIEIDRRGIDIGRDTYLDWTLPDPERFISGKHCEIHYRDGAYWLHDVSTNGTSINGQPGRLTEPYCLTHGDRIHIGPYIVLTELSGLEAGATGPGPVPDKGGTSVSSDLWGGVENTAEAVDRRDFAAHAQASGRPREPDLAEENISWGMGDVAPASETGADWGSPAAAQPADNSAWGAPPPPQQPSASATDWGDPPAAAETAPAAADWSAPPASTTPAASSGLDWGVPASDGASPGASPWDAAPSPVSPEPAASPQPAAAEPKPMAEQAPTPPAAEENSLGHNAFLAEAALAPEPEVAPEPAPPTSEPAPVAAEPEPESASDVFGQLSESAAVPPPPAPQPVASPPVAEPAPVAQAPAAQPVAPSSGASDFVSAFERGAGLPAGSVAGRDDAQLAEELGLLFRNVTQALQAMLLARAETKSAMRSSERTMIGALENNPLKFSPTPEDAMRIMFGQKTRSYLDAGQTIEQSFADLQKHQMQTFGAMQSALQVLIEDLDPENIAGATAKDGGLAALVSSRRAKFWDTYVERFKAKSAHHDRGMIDAFMILFAEMYDRQR